MSARPNVHAENLLAAGRRFGDARVAHERLIHAWQRGMDRTEMMASNQACADAEDDLHRAARAYATRMRRKAA